MNEISKGKEVMGTAAATTKVLTSEKVVGKPIPNPAKQEQMQRRKNKYQRDKRGYIIDNAKEKEIDKVNGKNIDETTATKNSFNVLQVEDDNQVSLIITYGNQDESKKEPERKKLENAQNSSSSPKELGVLQRQMMETLILVLQGFKWIHKERMVHWVQIRFGAPREVLNVTVN